MAVKAVVPKTLVRCPVCFERLATGSTIGPEETLGCPGCCNTFTRKEAFPLQDIPASNTVDQIPNAVLGDPRSRYQRWSGPVALTTGGWLVGWAIGHGMKGPPFIIYFISLFVALITIAFIVRHSWRDQWRVSIIAFLIYEGVGVHRIITGLQKEMHTFCFLIGLMAIGGIVFFMRAKAGAATEPGNLMSLSKGVCGGCNTRVAEESTQCWKCGAVFKGAH